MTATIQELILDGEDVTVDEFDYDFIYDAIRWADKDEDWLASLDDDEKVMWGEWHQGSWGYLVPGRRRRNMPFRKSDTSEVAGISVLSKEQVETAVRDGACGSSYCMAGQRVSQDKRYRLLWQWDGTRDESATLDYCIEQIDSGNVDDRGRTIWIDRPGAPREQVSDVAQRLMGITTHEAGRFFSGGNTVSRLQMYANGMCERRGIPLMFPGATVWNFDESDEEDD